VGIDEDWRLLTSYLFEDAGYTAYAARDARQAARFVSRVLPDAVVVQMDEPDGLDVLMRLPRDTNADVPIVVLVESLGSAHAQRVRALGGEALALDATDLNALVGEVDALIVVSARGPRALNRRLLDLQELARHYTPDAEGRALLRRLIDQLQVAVLAVDEHGHCIAASQGATALTGFSRLQLLTKSLFEIGFVRELVSGAQRRGFPADRPFRGTATIVTQAGDNVAVHAAAVAEILPGFHVAAFAAAHPRAAKSKARPGG
jgi:PAS domain S-box-containing protein